MNLTLRLLRGSCPAFAGFLSLCLAAQTPEAQSRGGVPAGRGGAGGRGGFGLSLAPALATTMLSQADKNADQKLTKDEFMALAEVWFDLLDSDGTGRLTQEEFNERFSTALPPPGPGRRGGGLPDGGASPRSGSAGNDSGRAGLASPRQADAEDFGLPGGRGGYGSSRFAGLFMAFDEDKDGALTRVDLKRSFERWFNEWNTAKNGSLDQDKLVAGLNTTLPRTNMGGATGRETQARIPGLPPTPPSPILTPEGAIKTLQLPAGFRVELTASEPMIEDPIALSFDEDGRLFVVEMRGFMPDIDRTGEREPVGRISLIEDADQDGRFEKATIFVDQLVLPRAVAAVRGGILYVSDYKLWFAQDGDGDGKADRTELVDAAYGTGNVEHAPNGLMPALDNWIYNARSQSRYRFMNGGWVKQRTEFRGQWGITQDNYGRLFYNVNNSQLLSDFTPPNYLSRNPHHRTSAGLNLTVATDQRVFTIRMNTAVNRGYLTNVLDASGKLYVFASSCSPVIYRGDNYPEEFQGNAFVCDPSANLIKRNIVFDQNLTLTSKLAYDNFEFLASTDERFRPVSAFNGPDGTLWVVDMYRGISQYGMFMTSYLRRETLERGLDKGIHLGRIYRIVSTSKTPAKSPRLPQESSAALVERLSHPNGWIRDTAQRLMVERGDRSIAPDLTRLAATGASALGRIHALWTLEGLLVALPKGAEESASAPPPRSSESDVFPDAPPQRSARLVSIDSKLALEAASLTAEILEDVLKAIDSSDPKVAVAAIRVAESLTLSSPTHQKTVLRKLAPHGKSRPPEVLFQAALSAGSFSKPEALPVLAAIATEQAESSVVRHAILSGLQNWELQFLQILLADPRWEKPQPGRGALLQALAAAVLHEGRPGKIETLLALAVGQKAGLAWRQKSLLDGLAATTPVRTSQPIILGAAPAAFGILAKSKDAAVRAQGERIRRWFAWPGQQAEVAVATQAAARSVTPGEEAVLTAGKLLFEQVCAGCHGLSGEGIAPLAPPLVNSSWVLGSENRLIRIALHGATGPMHVNGTHYEPPQTLPDMPSLQDALDDRQIAAVLSYIRRDWGHKATPVSPAEIAKIRRETQPRETPWTEVELLQIK